MTFPSPSLQHGLSGNRRRLSYRPLKLLSMTEENGDAIARNTGGNNGGGHFPAYVVDSSGSHRESECKICVYFNTDNGDRIQSRPYIFALGLLTSQYALTGYDASAHMTEGTKNADINGPKGIISATGISLIVKWDYLLGIMFAVTDVPHLISEDNEVGGYAIAEVFYQVFKSRYGNGIGGIICLGVVAVAIFFRGMNLVTNNSSL